MSKEKSKENQMELIPDIFIAVQNKNRRRTVFLKKKKIQIYRQI
jgi:hypothetical protein